MHYTALPLNLLGKREEAGRCQEGEEEEEASKKKEGCHMNEVWEEERIFKIGTEGCT